MHKKKLLFLSMVVSVFISFTVQAQDWQPVQKVDQTSVLLKYKSFAELPNINITIPTVIQVSVNAEQITNGAEIFDDTDKKFVYSNFDSLTKAGPRVVSLQLNRGMNTSNLIDNNLSTFADFYINNDPVYITYNYSEVLKSNSLRLSLAENSVLPDLVTIRAVVGGKYVVLVNNIKPTGSTINFPVTSSQNWIVEITHSQPLRLSELTFNNTVSTIAKTQIRFLAQPNHRYTLYANSENIFGNGTSYTNRPELKNASGVKDIGTVSLVSNKLFTPSDLDNDGVPDQTDNCKNVANADQKDENSNGVGDLCDDYDRDFIANNIDNCANIPNMDQKDTDGDKIGDLCDEDESRLTEKYPIIVWGGIFFAFIVFAVLLFIAGKKIKDNKGNNEGNINNANL